MADSGQGVWLQPHRTSVEPAMAFAIKLLPLQNLGELNSNDKAVKPKRNDAYKAKSFVEVCHA